MGLRALPSTVGVAQGACDCAPRGACHQPQSDTAHLVLRAPATPAQAPPAHRQTTPPSGCALRLPTTCGPSTSVRRDRGSASRQVCSTSSTAHQRVSGCRRSHSIDADGVVATIERLVAQREAPAHLRTDNGPELVQAALTPRRRMLNTEDFADLLEAQVVLEDWANRIQHLPATPIPRRTHPGRCLHRLHRSLE